jgi:CDP-diglyceride synthetase
MEEMKHWYLSKTVWGALIAIVASLLPAMGMELVGSIQGELADHLVSLAGAVGGLLAIYGRLTAEKRLG